MRDPELSEYVAGTLDRDLPPEVVAKTKLHVLDTLAAMLSGSRLKPGELGAAYVARIGGTPEATVIGLELRGGMGRTRIPPPGSVPEPGETLCYTSVLAENVPSAGLPTAEETPWTHGGPPQPYMPTEDDAGEVWD